MPYFLMMIDIENKKILIVGGGKVAFQKARVLKQFCRNITMLADEFDGTDSDLHFARKPFEKDDINGFDLVIGADKREINIKISEICREKRIAVNIVDDADRSDFMFPAVYKEDNLVVTVSTSGKSPTAACKIRDDIAKSLPDNIEDILEKLNAYRAELSEKGLSFRQRKELLAKRYDELV